MIEERDLVLSNGIHCIADIHSELYARLKKNRRQRHHGCTKNNTENSSLTLSL